jgi:hypothetical protein
MPSLKRAFELLAQQRRPLRLQRIARRIISELKEHDLGKEAAEVESWLNNASPSAAPAMDAATKRPVLPTHCPSCGAAVRPDEVEWLDDTTAECAYCGSPLREHR